jgi:leucyl aminopeptidase
MPGGNAQRPGDVVKSMSGKTIEVLDTDAEGRLILVDALTYVQKNFTPKLIIDLATLTGAIVVALGSSYAGCFANEENFAKNLIESGEKVNEKLWRMPLHKDYHEAMKSDCADIANISSIPGGGSCTAAAFIEKFIDEKMVWAHLDIAGVAWNNKGQKGAPFARASGFGVKLLHQFIYDHHEDK